jgi:hypothetical protein
MTTTPTTPCPTCGQPATMLWTTTPPSAPGYFWWRLNAKDTTPEVVRVTKHSIWRHATEYEMDRAEWAREFPGSEWSGPLAPPSLLSPRADAGGSK